MRWFFGLRGLVSRNRYPIGFAYLLVMIAPILVYLFTFLEWWWGQAGIVFGAYFVGYSSIWLFHRSKKWILTHKIAGPFLAYSAFLGVVEAASYAGRNVYFVLYQPYFSAALPNPWHVLWVGLLTGWIVAIPLSKVFPNKS